MIRKIADSTMWLCEDESGAAMVEYAILLALISAVSITALRTLGSSVKGTYSAASGAMP